MNKRKLAQRPASPAPPINARKVPAAQSAGNEPQEELMIDISSEAFEESVEAVDEPREAPVRITDEPDDEPVRIYGEEEPEDEDEVKVYVPQKKEHSEDIFSDSSHTAASAVYDESEAEPDFAGEAVEDNRHLGIWITVIIALSVMCVGAAGLYAFVNGYFDGIITALF